ncbi:unnamed protein product [Plasmodium vivax]|uniref:(malaria parasite P. vivax) hypothetical protein n=1 Tax=Plasmodium vivax TaxID=5855 RepID=A0A8S4HA00_PLAVI|nr:unnamed protein product [Plasmodium vivax]
MCALVRGYGPAWGRPNWRRSQEEVEEPRRGGGAKKRWRSQEEVEEPRSGGGAKKWWRNKEVVEEPRSGGGVPLRSVKIVKAYREMVKDNVL